jgi:hypothetical protein
MEGFIIKENLENNKNIQEVYLLLGFKLLIIKHSPKKIDGLLKY